jgi:translation initiation factor IF-2
VPAKKIRVHELAKELGLHNKDILDYCGKLGIGAASHSSSIEDAQGDRIRRRADADGVVGSKIGIEEAPATKAVKKTAAKKAAAPVADGETGAPVKKVAKKAATKKATKSTAAADILDGVDAAAASALAAAIPGLADEPAVLVADQPQVAAPKRRVVSSSSLPASTLAPTAGSAAADEAITQDSANQTKTTSRPPMPGMPGAEPVVRPPMPGMPGAEGEGEIPRGPRQPMSQTGRMIPPPPGARGPMSQSGRMIPPPPGGRGAPGAPAGAPGGRVGGPGAPRAGASGAPRTSGGPGGPRTGGAPAGGGYGAPRTGGAPSAGGFGGPRAGATGGPGGPGGPRGANFGGGGVPGMGTRGGPAAGARGGARGGGAKRRTTSRRRRNQEELEPTKFTAYLKSDAPTPSGEIIVERGITPSDFGPKLNRTGSDVIRFLFLQGEMLTPNTPMNDEMIELFALDLGVDVKLVNPGELKEAEIEQKYFADYDEEVEDDSLGRPRPPVVTVMGHVDHGKTTVLDRIRNANVVAGEAGGITQHIGAYQVHLGDDRRVTFIDTPGHEAFTAMRMRGANVTDIVVLVVAADDGVMPQTLEALSHAKAAGVPIVVALNKIDRADADPNRVMGQLSEHGLMPESWGGDTVTIEMSALQNLGIDTLLENLAVIAELADFRANPEGRGRGIVLEANLDIGRGPVATVLVQSGTLRVGDPIVAGAAFGRVRALIDDHGEMVKEALPSTPVQVLGFSDVPGAGDGFRVTADDKTARTIGETREHHHRVAGMRTIAAASAMKGEGGAKLEDIFAAIEAGETATLSLIVKADVQGSLEAVTASLKRLEREKVKLAIVHQAPGAVTERDVQLAATTGATIIGFNVRPDRKSREMAEAEKVEIRTYEIIYKLIEDIEAAMVGMLAPEYEEVVTGDAEVREIFRVPKLGAIAGCYVRNGVVSRNSKVRFLREGVVIWNGSIQSLRRFKDDAKEVAAGFECGIGLSDFQDLKPGDVIETYELKEIPRS